MKCSQFFCSTIFSVAFVLYSIIPSALSVVLSKSSHAPFFPTALFLCQRQQSFRKWMIRKVNTHLYILIHTTYIYITYIYYLALDSLATKWTREKTKRAFMLWLTRVVHTNFSFVRLSLFIFSLHIASFITSSLGDSKHEGVLLLVGYDGWISWLRTVVICVLHVKNRQTLLNLLLNVFIR